MAGLRLKTQEMVQATDPVTASCGPNGLTLREGVVSQCHTSWRGHTIAWTVDLIRYNETFAQYELAARQIILTAQAVHIQLVNDRPGRYTQLRCDRIPTISIVPAGTSTDDHDTGHRCQNLDLTVRPLQWQTLKVMTDAHGVVLTQGY